MPDRFLGTRGRTVSKTKSLHSRSLHVSGRRKRVQRQVHPRPGADGIMRKADTL